MSIKEKEQYTKTEVFNNVKESELYRNVLEKFPDANLIEVLKKKE